MIHLVPTYDVHSNITKFVKVEKPTMLQPALNIPDESAGKELKAAKLGKIFTVAELIDMVKDKSLLKDRRWPDLSRAALELA